MTIHYLNGNRPYCGHPCWSGQFAGSSKSEEVTCGLCLGRMEAASKASKAQELALQGLSVKEIALRLCTSAMNVYRYLRA